MAWQGQQGAGAPGSGPKVVGMGSCGLDYLAQVAAFPRPDDKLRTENLEVQRGTNMCECHHHPPRGSAPDPFHCMQTQGGGNAANALTAAARLGLAPVLLAKIGDDSVGDAILAELQRDRVCTDHVVRGVGQPSPFTYIIVDRTGAACCILLCCLDMPGMCVWAGQRPFFFLP
jgi:sugar/nucleoside kinase (ribokinase family)